MKMKITDVLDGIRVANGGFNCCRMTRNIGK
nr:MAG TPA: hypothetical protein [Caudoviricetes sp.]DAQ93283.1 MAG TPA: hypothetical protein [Caudoviricetes sp.]DAS96348.1 MAG TPA: hypothetical protein [Caudoviricetes sp.]DAV47313.1 MAG TPA: hypothetical protein [Caudoviricetes sp.]DAW08784.1 MAG TPA: hypothetical protein [Caudoviricetes sp.]